MEEWEINGKKERIFKENKKGRKERNGKRIILAPISLNNVAPTR